MPRVLIIGYGNPLRGDDGLGWHVIERLRSELAGPEIALRAMHQLTPELTEDLSRAGRAIFVDAAAEGHPGSISRRRLVPEPDPSAFTHRVTPAALLSAARALFGHAPEAELFSVAVESVELGASLSPAVRQAAEEVVAAIRILAGEFS